jgi:deazaflavin-dependent oxidoreductase (nitroreductase family)
MNDITTTPVPSTASTVRYLEPDVFTRRVFNPLVSRLTSWGLSVRGSRILAVTGRTSGQVRTTVVNPLTVDGSRYLVAPRGTTQWVRNLRAAGNGTLRVGRRTDRFDAVELADADKTSIIRAYLKEWAWETGRFFEGLSAKSSDDEVRRAAAGFPVFRIESGS